MSHEPDEKRIRWTLPRWVNLLGIAPDFPDESDARAIRREVAEEIAQALLDFEANDIRGRADTGAEYNLPQLLDFWSGFDPADGVHDGYIGDCPAYVFDKPTYGERDLIRVLVAEVRRLRFCENHKETP